MPVNAKSGRHRPRAISAIPATSAMTAETLPMLVMLCAVALWLAYWFGPHGVDTSAAKGCFRRAFAHRHMYVCGCAREAPPVLPRLLV